MRVFALAAVAALLFALVSAASATEVPPLGLTNLAVGGGKLNDFTPGVENGVGLNNIGLLVRVWGKVTDRDLTNQFFYVDDGSGRNDGSGYIGIRVSYANLAPGNSITPPAKDAYVQITGISSTVVINNKIQPNVRPRRQGDIQP